METGRYQNDHIICCGISISSVRFNLVGNTSSTFAHRQTYRNMATATKQGQYEQI